MDSTALKLSFQLAAVTTVALVIIGLPMAQWLATTRCRAKVLVEAVVALPLVLPPTVLGFYLLVAFGPRTPLGRAWAELFGGPLPFSFGGLVVASIVYSLPFAVQPFAAALVRVDRNLVEASHSLGVSRVRTFFRINLPLAAPGILAGCVLAFAHALGEFGVVLMVGGNIPGETRTLSIAIFNHVEQLEYEAAGRTSLLLLAISFAVLVVTYTLQRGRGRGGTWAR